MQTAKSIDERAGETHKGRTRVPRTKTTRALALLLALILLGGLVWWTWRKTGKSADRLVYRTENYRAL